MIKLFKTVAFRLVMLLAAITAADALLIFLSCSYLASADGDGVFVWAVAASLVLLAEGGALAAVIAFTFSRPLKKLRRDIEAYGSGGDFAAGANPDEIGLLRDSFAGILDSLEREREKQSRIIASISHDIKTPLTSVMGYAEMLRSPSLSEERRAKYLNIVYAKSIEIKNTVDEFDDYLCCGADSAVDMSLYEVGELCEKIVSSLRDEMICKGIKLNLVCRASGKIYADAARLYRVFANSVANSVRHGGRGADTEVNIYVTRDGGDFVFALTDNGCGAERAELERIFEPLYTTDKSRSVAGLGLSICRSIIAAHGGEIYAESERGKYFSVVFKLKAA